jgi:hypothetical protein
MLRFNALNNIIEMNYIIFYNKSLARFGTIFGGGGGGGGGGARAVISIARGINFFPGLLATGREDFFQS